MNLNLGIDKLNLQTTFSKTLTMFDGILNLKKGMQDEDCEKTELLSALDNARYDLNAAQINFDSADNSELLDVCIYNLKAAQTTYNYLIRKVREKNISVS